MESGSRIPGDFEDLEKRKTYNKNCLLLLSQYEQQLRLFLVKEKQKERSKFHSEHEFNLFIDRYFKNLVENKEARRELSHMTNCGSIIRKVKFIAHYCKDVKMLIS